jgi:hypothetical protein
MVRFKISCVLTALMLLSPSLFAQKLLVDDFSSGTNQNYLEEYWYYYDDNRGTKIDDRPLAAPRSRQSIINAPYSLVNREASGNKADTFKIRNYAFCVKEQNGNKYGAMPFTFGEKWKASWGYAEPYVRMGTMLAPDRKFINLYGATAVKFKLRSHVNDLTINFILQTMDIAKDSSLAYYQTVVVIPKGSWIDFTVSIADLAQPAWATSAQTKSSLDIQEATNFAWEVAGTNNPGITSDTVDIDDIVIEGVSLISHPPNPPPSRPTTAAFCTFETIQHNETPLHTFWHAFDDLEYQGNSTITRGAYKNPSNGLYNLDWVLGSGFGDDGYGPWIEFSLGKTLKHAAATGDSVPLQGFSGMGCDVYDSAGAIYLNAETGKFGSMGGTSGFNSVYFEYIADGEFKNLTIEIRDIYDVPDKNNPDRKDSRGLGNVWHYDLPKSSTWRSAEVSLGSLVIDSIRKDYVPIPLDKTKLAKILFKARGSEGTAGIIQVDNIYFPGMSCFGCTGMRQTQLPITHATAMGAFYKDGSIHIKGGPGGMFVKGTISLVDARGKVVLTQRCTSAADFAMNMSGRNVPNGLYFVKANGMGGDGKPVSFLSAITLAK